MKTNTNDSISRQAAIEALGEEPMVWDEDADYELGQRSQWKADKLAIESVSPEREAKLNEWCTDCKEYDQDRHCCPRWNRVIRNTVEELRAEHAKEAPQRMHGRWIERIEDMDGMKLQIMRCSECGSSKPMKLFILENYEFNFCPNCGCAMTEGAEDEQIH